MQLEKSIRSIKRAKVWAFTKKLAVPVLEIGLVVVTKRAPTGSRLGKVAKAAAVGVPIVQGAVSGRSKKSDAQVEQDENQAHKVIDRVLPILGKIPNTWPKD